MLPEGKGFIKGFDWGLYPEAENFLRTEVSRFLKNNVFAKNLSVKMKTYTSTHFFDWIDHIILPQERVRGIKKLGFEYIGIDGTDVFKHTKTVFFPVVIGERDFIEIVLKPEDIEHFTKKFGGRIEGERFAPYRKAAIRRQGKYILSAAERRGYNGFAVHEVNDVDAYKKSLKIFAERRRKFPSDKKGLDATQKLVESRMKKLSPARAADAFFRNERTYWQGRNHAGRIQKARQDKLGLGWGNHDHHTYRSSRKNFRQLIEIFERFGYVCRERFFAGEAAGWGAQILEHPVCDIVLFADVDITKNEKDMDFAHSGLANRKNLGTVGLWIGLHGESILQAGLHHLEARFDFERLRKDLPRQGANMMNPFSYFEFLKQAFTEGEYWTVDKKRLDALLKRGSITRDQYNNFLKHGAIGSHMENLQRTQGFKGFNQDSVTAILKATDPRKHMQPHRYA